MTYEELVAKIKKGEALSGSEIEDFGKVTRPVDRFNELADAKRNLENEVKTLKDKVSALEAEKVSLVQNTEDTFNAKFKEISGVVETLTSENNSLKQYKAQMEKLQQVQRIANVDCKEFVEGATFKDPEYLATLLDRKGVELNDKEKVKNALLEIKAEKPEQFYVAVTPGSGTGSEPNNTSAGTKIQFKSSAERMAYVEKYGFDAYSKVKGDQ